MKFYVLDSSALVKVYLPEAGSARVLALLSAAARGGAHAVVSVLSYPESVSAVARRERNGRITPMDAATQIARIDADFAAPHSQFALVEATSALAAQAAALVHPHALSGADAVHLATALSLRTSLPAGDTVELVTTDGRLERAAMAEGLTVIVPG